ncbi:hypothetical protein D3C75_1254590 [compost metagenome]
MRASEDLFFKQVLKVLTITVFEQWLSEAFELFGVDPAGPIANFLRAGDLQPLAALHGCDVLAGIE